MTNAQTEARAIAERLSIHHSDADRIAIIATALAAKDAELAEVKVSNNKWLAKWERAEAHLAEANKAIDKALDPTAHGVNGIESAEDHVQFMHSTLLAARRAREQGGE